MNRTMITATNTLSQLQQQLDTISNNIANIDTTGYKRREATFTELLYQQFNNQPNANKEVGRLTPYGIRQGTGAKVAQSQIYMAQGNVKSTSRDLDTAFTKENLLYKVSVNNGVQYTRNGAFYLTPIGENEMALVNGDGYFILDQNDNPITINGEPKSFSISENGQLKVTTQNNRVQTFELGVVRVNNPQFLEAKGDSLYGLPENFNQLGVNVDDVLTDLTGALRGEIAIQQGALEQSNVDLSQEMTDLINVQRSYQFQSRSVSLADQMMGLVNGIR